jgi:hypothetical protein
MEAYNRLPEHLQWLCEKMYFTHNVLPELMEAAPNYTMCGNCINNGLPCLNCADYIHNGHLGPGYLCGRRVLIPDTDDDEVLNNMLNYMLTHHIGHVDYGFQARLQDF